ncbi:hypothetical protein D9757_008806 [Collybiopsis confluens]|uniref:Uncharacterized protein n=1 Tax=Collybiopsis confluens TaxID=2823264 RepID=A0A8H5M1F9_9AGAR|nr:hypothetical protein D9757_008806 [Collybiopsis confluens]
MASESCTHAFFTLPTELHTHIFTFACSPSDPNSGAFSYCTAFSTGLALSLVSKYVQAASTPVRYRTVVLCSWNQMLAFERVLSGPQISRSRVRYLSIICDEVPKDIPGLLPGLTCTLECTLLDIIKQILYAAADDLYELDIGLQAISCIKNPLAYLSFSGSLYFPQLEKMFYACSPSNVLPWFTNNITYSSPTRCLSGFPIICPRVKDLTVVCASGVTSENFHHYISSEDAQEAKTEVAVPPQLGECSDIGDQFPSLQTLTIHASTPEQALAAILDEDGLAWEAGSTFRVNLPCMQKPGKSCTWPPRSLQTVVFRPKALWNERWDSLRDVLKGEEQSRTINEDKHAADDVAEMKLRIVVVKPGGRK